MKRLVRSRSPRDRSQYCRGLHTSGRETTASARRQCSARERRPVRTGSSVSSTPRLAHPHAKRPVCRKIGYVPVRSKNTSEIDVIRLTPHPRPIVCQRLQRENRIFVWLPSTICTAALSCSGHERPFGRACRGRIGQGSVP